MNPVQSLYSALGEIIYGIASANHAIEQDEKDLLQKIVRSELNRFKRSNGAGIILEHQKKHYKNVEKEYHWAMQNIEDNATSLNTEMKALFISIIKKVAAVFPPVTIERQNIADRFVKDINDIRANHQAVHKSKVAAS